MELQELTAKVLATENLSVFKKKARTAYFDLVNRTLVIPQWENLDPVVESMLIMHEVGHALFTPSKEYVDAAEEFKHLRSYLNVIEDARIERLMKERYPGGRKTFTNAYKVIRETDFFELGDRNINELNFVDRINMYFKLGVLCGVKFSKEEYPFILRASNAVTFEEVLQLAKDIYKFVKETKEEQKQALRDIDSLSDDEDTSSDVEEFEDFDSDEEFEDPSSSDDDDEYGEQESEEEHDSLTDSILKSKLEEMAGNDDITTYTFSEEYRSDLVVGYKEILKNCRETAISRGTLASEAEVFNDFKNMSIKQVNHLVQQFELKKAAEIYVRRRVTKTGQLDVNKISQYKIKDDIFRRAIISPEGENHGIVMLLDWSRSMLSGNNLYHSIRQVIQLVMFCNKLSIPFRVYAFSSNISPRITYTSYQKYTYNGNDALTLLELFNNKMTTKELNDMMTYACGFSLNYTYKLQYTPLSPALLAMRKIIPEFMAENKVKKLNFVTFTDGGCTSPLINDFNTTYIFDQQTKKNYLVHRNERAGAYKNVSEKRNINSVNCLYRIIKDRYNATVTTFFIKSSNLVSSIKWAGVYDANVDNCSKYTAEYKKNGFAKLTGFGRDSIYVVDPNILRTSTFNVESINSNMTPTAIARQIKGSSKTSIKSKILIEKLGETLA